MTTADDILDRLDRLLEEERALLRAGHLQPLAELLARKEALVTQLAETGIDATQDTGLQTRIARNQKLLESAMAGLHEVASRLAEARDLRRTLETYGSDGRRAAVGSFGGGRMERRA